MTTIEGPGPTPGTTSVISQSFWVPGPIPGMNDIVASAKSGHGKGNAYARMKREWNEIVAVAALAARLKPMTGRVAVILEWKERTLRRDPDNIHAGVKFVLDGLVQIGILPTDSQRCIASITHEPVTIGNFPGVRVTLHSHIE